MQSDASRKKRNWILNLNVCCAWCGFSRGSTLKAETGKQRRGWSFWCISIQSLQVYQLLHRHLERCFVNLLLQACALHKLRVYFGDVSSAFLQTSASEEHQELTIKAPPEVGYLFSDSEGKHARYVRLMKSFYGLTSAPRACGWISHRYFLSLVGNPCRLINVYGVVILMTVS